MVIRMSKAFWVIAASMFVAITVVDAQQVPCFFIFGDSMSDSGNNNNLKSKAKVNFAPYGIDFPKGPTGRFTNGRTTVDFIGEMAGFKEFIPPFAGVLPEQAHTGINYASGAGGIRGETSKHLGERISLRHQIQNHQTAIERAKVPLQRLQQCLYTINIGSNDYVNNYFIESYNTKSRYTPTQFAFSLTVLYRTQLKILYRLGARKVAIFGLSQIGCTPMLKRSHSDGKTCAKEVNDAVKIFNQNLAGLVSDFNKEFKDVMYTFVDLFTPKDPKPYAILGVRIRGKGCCTVTPGESELCVPDKPVCANRSEYIFWDDIHSTEATNRIMAEGSFEGKITQPYSIAQLVKNER